MCERNINNKTFTLKEICQYLELDCDNDAEIQGINTLHDANENEISFLENPKYEKFLKNTKAKAVLIRKEDADKLPEGVIPLITDEPYLKLAILTKLFVKDPWEDGGYQIAFSAKVHPSVQIGKGARIGKNSVIMPGCVIGPDVEIGDNCVIYPNVTVYRDTQIGNNVKIHAGSVIGSDGFGYAHTKDGRHIKIYHLGFVEIEDDVEIGANTTIDRGVFGKTVIKKGTIIDNLVQIAHNCEVGEGSILVSQVGLAGSTKLGHHVVMGGQSATAGHLEVAPMTTIAARGGVSKSIKKPGVYSGFPLMPHKQWLKLQGLLNRLLKKS
ncbi:UDP-3-O-[3-hydroxymyristoyl] glucosamine N-acyltransferase [Nautilia profundicola AmH]|uniref:UDP-3-O-acylglucosamine N-acyltransferase n=1 Tax=Nautilia profundicola (strain ATCC BAA-1463 / DSM 18972 / AmH) TaxID=598659 RepID=B9L9A6_NAUPA|nr:UDP-3-O-(3-hydroxymyristoyl)glucosamine N-acyltransferase [Nautilia profundicola]ACM92357.1 UDP-3-O-[3-hydroxymyristoyl] glucosamine N-acyltransferase [Nautilia profundicola AmH]